MEMESINQNDPQLLKIQGLLDRHFASGISFVSSVTEAGHLDEDSIAAFVDGNVSEREALPMVRHLIDCSFCRHVTAELVKLDAAFAENGAVTTQPASKEPTRVSEVLSGIMERIFGTGDAAVFAHSEEDEDMDEKKDELPKA